MTDVKIKCDDCKFVEDCVDYGWEGCRKFTPKPSEPMTEQEYLQSCNTEQLAEWFTNNGYLPCRLRDCTDCKYYDKKNDDCDFSFYGSINHKQMWVEWLKQPHTKE